MCGFVAWIETGNRLVDREKLKSMTRLLAHRGPDDEGFHFGDWYGLGFRRLSILDLSRKGHQPMVHAESGRVMVYNGEVYNYKEIRSRLVRHGYSFVSGTDSEVLLKAYDHWGPECVKQFVGMFAMVIVEPGAQKVLAFRDPFGIKPLYVHRTKDRLIFASEVKALLPLADLAPRREAFYEQLAFRYRLGPSTMFQDVEEVHPGSYWSLKADGSRPRRSMYFNLAETFTAQEKPGSTAEAVEAVRELVETSVKWHLRSDVEVGVQLSGGLDSSLVTAFSALNHPKGMHTFSVSFPGFDKDESAHQKLVSQRYHTVHHDLRLDGQTFCDLLPRALWHFDQPLHDPNCVAIHALCGMAAKHVKVLLTGDGADEIFSGYHRYGDMTRLRALRALGRLPIPPGLVPRDWPFRRFKGLHRQLGQLAGQNASVFVSAMADPAQVDRLCPDLPRDISYRDALCRQAPGGAANEISLLDQWGYLQPWLWRADRMGMAHGLECRVPFITSRVAARLNGYPLGLRVRGGERKFLLKKAAEPYLDRSTIYRRKIGFSTPFASWLARGPGSIYLDLLREPAARGRGIFNPRRLDELLDDFRAGKLAGSGQNLVWSALNLEMWHRIFIDRTMTP